MPSTVTHTAKDTLAGLVKAFATMLLFGGLIFVYQSLDLGFLRNEISAYGVYCDTPSGEMPCPSANQVQMLPVHYKVLADQQAVLYWLDDSAPQRLKNCAVVSRTDWKCENVLGVDIGFKDGQFWQGYPGKQLSAAFVNRYEWLLANKAKK